MSKIPSHLPQFENRTILLIVAGEKAGNLFIAKNGTIKKLHFISSLHPKFHNKNLLLRLIARIIAQKTNNPETIRKNFLINLHVALEKIHANCKIHQVHLFCPSFMRQKIKRHLPGQTDKKLANIFIGSYTEHKSRQLIESIAQVRDQELRSLLEKIAETNPLPEKAIYNKVAVISK